MARPLRIEFPGAFYHVTARGNEKKDIFRSRKDRERFFTYLETAIERYGAVLHCYCLMTNHYHLLMETPRGNLSEIMRFVNGAYTTYYNVKRKRAGHLFQGRYKSIVVDAEDYALELSRYMHLNPVRAGMVAKPEDYEWSSYHAYAGFIGAPSWLETKFILSSFGEKFPEKRYRTFVEDLLGTQCESPLQKVVASTLLGSAEFVAQISEKHLNTLKPDRSVPAVQALSRTISVVDIVRKVEEIVPHKPLARKVAIYACHRYGGGKLKEIGKLFGVGDTAVSQASKRLGAEAQRDKELAELLSSVRNALIL